MWVVGVQLLTDYHQLVVGPVLASHGETRHLHRGDQTAVDGYTRLIGGVALEDLVMGRPADHFDSSYRWVQLGSLLHAAS